MTNEFTRQFENVKENGSNIISKISDLAEAHLKLYKEETSESRQKLLGVFLLLAGAALTGSSAIIFASFSLVQFLINTFASLSRTAALGLVSILWFSVAATFVYLALKIFRTTRLTPVATISSLKESFQCLVNPK